jgi:hypothetical protein
MLCVEQNETWCQARSSLRHRPPPTAAFSKLLSRTNLGAFLSSNRPSLFTNRAGRNHKGVLTVSPQFVNATEPNTTGDKINETQYVYTTNTILVITRRPAFHLQHDGSCSYLTGDTSCLRYESNRLMRSIGLWRWHINITVMDIIHCPVSYLTYNVSEKTGLWRTPSSGMWGSVYL